MRLFPLRRPSPPRRREGPLPMACVADPAPVEERPRGCGWFESSHDLQRGLRVTEHADADAVVNLVPLSWWLAWELDAALSVPPARPRS